MKTLTANFLTQVASTPTAPYLILEIQWSDATRYYIDRNVADFSASGVRCPVGSINAVQEWGSVNLSLREQQVNSADDTTVTLWDAEKTILTLLAATPQQRRRVRIWRLFDHATTVWPTDAALIFDGATTPFGWAEKDQTIQVNIEDASKRLVQVVGKRALKATFPLVHPEHEDRVLPIIFGKPRRVEAVLIQRPWATQIYEAAPIDQLSAVIDILDHPSELGVLTGAGNEYDVWLGNDAMTGYFTASADPANVPSTFTITNQIDTTLCRAPMTYVDSANKAVVRLQISLFQPRFFPVDQLTIGTDVRIYQPESGYVSRTVSAILIGDWGPDWMKVTLDSPLGSSSPGMIDFLQPWSVRRPWPIGTPLTARGQEAESYVYLANMLPSDAVSLVEGFGTLTDEGGETCKDFVCLDPSDYTVNLNNPNWAGALGHNVTTIAFSRNPRALVPALDDMRMWVTVRGIKSQAGTYLTHPVDILEEYLTNTNLMALASASLDTASFTAAKTELGAVEWGVVQQELRPGLESIQEWAAQAHLLVMFDQGTVRLVVLRNTAGTIRGIFTPDNILAESLSFTESSVSELVSHLRGRWRRDWDDVGQKNTLDVLKFNSAVVTAFGMNEKSLDITAYASRSAVESELLFWLNRWTRVYETVEFSAWLEAVVLQPGDWIRLSFTDGEGHAIYTNKEMEVVSVSDEPGGVGKAPAVKVTARWAKFTY